MSPLTTAAEKSAFIGLASVKSRAIPIRLETMIIDEKYPYMMTYLFYRAGNSTQANAVSFNLDKCPDVTNRGNRSGSYLRFVLAFGALGSV